MTNIERYVVPKSLDEAAEVLRNGAVTILAGGTDLMPQAKSGKLAFKPVIMNIRRVSELRGIAISNGVIRIGALTTITDMLDSADIRAKLPALWQACDHFASDQIRNAGTIGGNICNASPAGDTHVPLIVLDARVVLAAKPNGMLATRTMPVREFLAGPGRTKREPSELLTAVEIDVPPAGSRSAFFKFGTRPALDISTISIGVGGILENNVIRQARVAFGAVAPTAIRSPGAEAALEGKPLDKNAIHHACAAADRDIHPITDVRASDWYRRELVRNMLERMLNNVAHG
jgi:CO/xanthine dehydrogenase FAD-binding subunit